MCKVNFSSVIIVIAVVLLLLTISVHVIFQWPLLSDRCDFLWQIHRNRSRLHARTFAEDELRSDGKCCCPTSQHRPILAPVLPRSRVSLLFYFCRVATKHILSRIHVLMLWFLIVCQMVRQLIQVSAFCRHYGQIATHLVHETSRACAKQANSIQPVK